MTVEYFIFFFLIGVIISFMIGWACLVWKTNSRRPKPDFYKVDDSLEKVNAALEKVNAALQKAETSIQSLKKAEQDSIRAKDEAKKVKASIDQAISEAQRRNRGRSL